MPLAPLAKFVVGQNLDRAQAALHYLPYSVRSMPRQIVAIGASLWPWPIVGLACPVSNTFSTMLRPKSLF